MFSYACMYDLFLFLFFSDRMYDVLIKNRITKKKEKKKENSSRLARVIFILLTRRFGHTWKCY